MATIAAQRSHHGTLDGTTADKITFSHVQDEIEVLNRDSAETLYCRAVSSPTITAGADGTTAVPPLQSVVLNVAGSQGVVVQVVGDDNDYSVEAM